METGWNNIWMRKQSGNRWRNQFQPLYSPPKSSTFARVTTWLYGFTHFLSKFPTSVSPKRHFKWVLKFPKAPIFHLFLLLPFWTVSRRQNFNPVVESSQILQRNLLYNPDTTNLLTHISNTDIRIKGRVPLHKTLLVGSQMWKEQNNRLPSGEADVALWILTTKISLMAENLQPRKEGQAHQQTIVWSQIKMNTALRYALLWTRNKQPYSHLSEHSIKSKYILLYLDY